MSCGMCGSKCCSKPGSCDEFAQIDRAIVTCAQVCHSVTLQDCHNSSSFRGMDAGQIFLAFKAGQILAQEERRTEMNADNQAE